MQPLTDEEYGLLLPLIPNEGRPSPDRRRVLDAIFHVALARCPWRELPATYGKSDTAHRQLRRWMQAGVLDAWLKAAQRPQFSGLRLRICRAWRRASRVASMRSILLAKQLGMQSALPCAVWFLPDPGLSETIQKLILRHLKKPFAAPRGFFHLAGKVLAFAGGQPRRWRIR